MSTTGLFDAEVCNYLYDGFKDLKDIELAVAAVMRKYGEDREMEGLLLDDISTDDAVAIRIAGEEEVSDYWEGLKKNGGGFEGVYDYLCERFKPMYWCEGKFDERAYVDMLEGILWEARRFEEKWERC